MKKKAAQSLPLPQFEVGQPETKKVFGVTQVTSQFPIVINDVVEGKVISTSAAIARGKKTAELLCLGVDSAKLLQKFANNTAICKSVANQSVKFKAELHRIIDRLAELGFDLPKEGGETSSGLNVE